MKHALERTSPKGQDFIGTCALCGQPGLPASAIFEDCPNVRGLTRDETILELILSPSVSEQEE